MADLTLARRTPLKRKAAKPRRTIAPRCSMQRCNQPARIQGWCVSHAEREADRRMSLWVRERDGFCTAEGVLEGECKGPLQAAHVVGRRNHTLRWDRRNVRALCAAHHYTVDQHGQEGAKFAWAEELMGGFYRDMMEDARVITKRVDAIEAALEWLPEGGKRSEE